MSDKTTVIGLMVGGFLILYGVYLIFGGGFGGLISLLVGLVILVWIASKHIRK